MKNIVIGGAGFIGSNLCGRLLEEGEDVLCIDDFSIGTEKNLCRLQGHKRFHLIRMDATDTEKLTGVFREYMPDSVFHLAANSDIQASALDPDVEYKNTYTTTFSVLSAMRKVGIKKLFFASTSAVYGDRRDVALNEETPNLSPISYYGAAKLGSEALISAFAYMNDMSALIFRFPNVTGPHLTHGVVYDFMRRLSEDGSKLRILGDGRQTKPYIYVGDLIDAILKFMNPPAGVTLYNVGVSGATSVKKIADIVCGEMGLTDVKYEFTGGESGWKGDVPRFSYDTGKIQRAGWTAKYDSDGAVRMAVRDMREEMGLCIHMNIPTCKAVIQAGGKGSRMAALTGGKIPKPMLEIEGKPMLLWQMENISRYGIKDFIIIIGHLGERIEEYFGGGERFGFHIDYIREAVPLGSAGSFAELRHFPAEKYLVVFGDVVFDMDIGRMLAFHDEKKASATLLVHPNSHPADSDIVCVEDGRAVGLLPKNRKRECFYHNCVNAGIYVLDRDVVDWTGRRNPHQNPNQCQSPDQCQNQCQDLSLEQCRRQLDMEKDVIVRGAGGARAHPVFSRQVDMEKDVIAPLMAEGRVCAYSTPEYVKDTGTPERFERVCQEKKSGIWEQKSLRNKQRCIFLDRDGTINKHKGFLTDPADLELEENVAEAIRKINESGYLAVVVTNQPVIARGECSPEELGEIHKKLETLLGNEGAYVDAIYCCPHHPNGGYPGERPEYKIRCKCRKPGTGMFEEAAERFNIDLGKSYMVGDTTRDMMAGTNAGVCTILVRTGEGGKDGKYDAKADYEAADLLDAVNTIIESEKMITKRNDTEEK